MEENVFILQLAFELELLYEKPLVSSSPEKSTLAIKFA